MVARSATALVYPRIFHTTIHSHFFVNRTKRYRDFNLFYLIESHLVTSLALPCLALPCLCREQRLCVWSFQLGSLRVWAIRGLGALLARLLLILSIERKRMSMREKRCIEEHSMTDKIYLEFSFLFLFIFICIFIYRFIVVTRLVGPMSDSIAWKS